MKTMGWDGELMECFGRANTKAVHHTIQEHRTKYNRKFDASKLLMKLDQMPQIKAHLTFTSPVLMILIALEIFLIGALIWKRCYQTQEPALPTPSAPQMQMPIFNSRPINKAMKLNALMLISISIS
jgi:hypothetical protein